MTTFAEARTSLAIRFVTEFHARRAEPIAVDNFDRLIAQDGSLVSKPDTSPWVRFSPRMASGNAITIGTVGNRTFRQAGVIISQVFIKRGIGDALAYEIADAIGDSLRAVTLLSGVRLFAPNGPENIGLDDSGWFRLQVDTDFEFDLHA